MDLRRSRTRSNIPVQKLLADAQEANSNGVETIEEKPSNPSRPPRHRYRNEQVESEAQSIIEQLKKL